MSSSPTPRIPLSRRVAYAAVVFVVFLVLLEGALSLVPRLAERTQHNEPGAEAGERVVLCLGDSVTFGWGLEEGLSWPSRLQQRLDADNRQVPVVNGGRGGATADTMRRRGPKLISQAQRQGRPIVLLLLGHNDVVVWRGMPGAPRAVTDEVGALGREARGPRVWRLMRWMVGVATRSTPNVQADLKSRDALAETVGTLQARTEDAGGRLFLMTYPLPGQPGAGVSAQEAEAISRVDTLQAVGNQWIRDQAAQRDLALIDLDAALDPPRAYDSDWFLDHIHPTAAVHARIAEVVEKYLVAAGELPPAG